MHALQWRRFVLAFFRLRPRCRAACCAGLAGLEMMADVNPGLASALAPPYTVRDLGLCMAFVKMICTWLQTGFRIDTEVWRCKRQTRCAYVCVCVHVRVHVRVHVCVLCVCMGVCISRSRALPLPPLHPPPLYESACTYAAE
jgi:hypothetical protein